MTALTDNPGAKRRRRVRRRVEARPDATPRGTPHSIAEDLLGNRGAATLAALLIVGLCVAPLPEGSVGLTARHTIVAAALGLITVLGVLWTMTRGKSNWQGLRAGIAPGTLWLVAIVGIGAIQLVPGVGTGAANLIAVEGDPHPSTLSVAPALTAAKTVEILAWISVGWMAGLAFGQPRRAQQLASYLLVTAGLLGIAGWLFLTGAIPSPHGGHPDQVVVGTFYNRNSFAGCLELALLFGCAPLYSQFRRRNRVALAALGLLWLCGLTALIGTESRAGLLAFGLGAVVFGLALRHATGRPMPWRGLAVVSAIGIVMVLTLIPNTLIHRFGAIGGELGSAGMRPDIWAAGLRASAEFPLLGSGLGTYGEVSPFFQAAEVPGHIVNAHCDPLELLAEGGLGGLACMALAVVCFARFAWRRLPHCAVEPRGQRLSDRAVLAAAGIGALSALAAHGLVDFNFQIPSNAIWTAAIAGTVFGLLRDRPITLDAASDRTPATLRIAWIGVSIGAGWLAFDASCAARSSAIIVPTAAAADAVAPADLRAAERLHPLGGEPARALGAALTYGRLRAPTTDADYDLGRIATRALRRNPLSPSARHLRARAMLRTSSDPASTRPAVRAAFELSLACVAPIHRLGNRRDIGLTLMVEGATAAAIAWQRDLLEHCLKQRKDAPLEVLRDRADAMIDTVLADAVKGIADRGQLAELTTLDAVTADVRDVQLRFAAVLLERGDFETREIALRQADGSSLAAARAAARGAEGITLAPGYRIKAQSIQPRTGPRGRSVEIKLWFEVPAEGTPAGPAPACALRVAHPQAQLVRSLTPTAEPFVFDLALDPTLPSGEYEVQLVFSSNGPPLRLGSLTVSPRTLAATVDRVYSVPSVCHWASPSRTRIQSTPDALTLGTTDRAWSIVEWPIVRDTAAGLALELATADTTQPPVVTWLPTGSDPAQAETLRRLDATSNLVRFAAPVITSVSVGAHGPHVHGTLTIRCGGDRPVALRNLFFEPPPTAGPPATPR